MPIKEITTSTQLNPNLCLEEKLPTPPSTGNMPVAGSHRNYALF